MKTIKLKYRSPEWLEYRNKGIGGSDAAAILGKNPYKTNIELWEEKCGFKEPKKISNAEAVEYGFAAEKYLLGLFKLDYPQYKTVAPKDILYIHGNGFMFASLDGELVDKKDKRRGVLEIKTSNIFASMHEEKWKDKIPDNYYIQVLHYMAVTGWEFAILKAQLKTTDSDGSVFSRTKHYLIERNDVKDDLAYLTEQETKFWQYVTKRIRPPLILPDI